MRSSPSPIFIMDTNLHILNKPRNINRSFRLSEEVVSILEKVDGKNINDKMNNLILYCFNYLPELEHRIQMLKDDQQTEYQKLLDIQRRVSNVRSLIDTLSSIERYGQQAERQLKALSEGLDDSGRKPLNVTQKSPAAMAAAADICDTEFDDGLDPYTSKNCPYPCYDSDEDADNYEDFDEDEDEEEIDENAYLDY